MHLQRTIAAARRHQHGYKKTLTCAIINSWKFLLRTVEQLVVSVVSSENVRSLFQRVLNGDGGLRTAEKSEEKSNGKAGRSCFLHEVLRGVVVDLRNFVDFNLRIGHHEDLIGLFPADNTVIVGIVKVLFLSVRELYNRQSELFDSYA